MRKNKANQISKTYELKFYIIVFDLKQLLK